MPAAPAGPFVNAVSVFRARPAPDDEGRGPSRDRRRRARPLDRPPKPRRSQAL